MQGRKFHPLGCVRRWGIYLGGNEVGVASLCFSGYLSCYSGL
jgi:hypothetical protein